MKSFLVSAVLLLSACSDSDGPDSTNGATTGNSGGTPGIPQTNPIVPSGEPVPFLLEEQLATLFEVANGEALQEMSAILLRLVSPIESGFTLQSSRTEESDLTDRDLYQCTSGGTVEVWKNLVDDEPRNYATAKECAFGPRVVSGVFYLTDPINESDTNYFLASEVKDYTVTDNVDDSTTTLDSGTVRYNSPDQTGDPRTAVSWGGEFLTVTRLAGSYSVSSSNYSTRTSDSNAPLPDGSLGRTTNLNALIDQSNELRQVRTTQAFQRAGNTGNFTSGILTVSGNQSSVALDANSGSAATFILTETKNGVSTSYAVPWSDRFQFRVLDPSNTELTFEGGAPP